MYWYGSGNETSTDPETCAARLAETHTNMAEYIPCDWREAQKLGLISTRQEYIEVLRRVCFYMAEEGIVSCSREKDVELLQMVRMLDETDTVINLMTERLVDWYISMTPAFSRKYQGSSGSKMVLMIGKKGTEPMKKIAREILSLTNARTNLMKEVSRKAADVLPNMSSLVGGLVAARLVSRAGGLTAAARMPGSSLQVIGAEAALFSHIRTGSSSPKHGIIFQHRRVHNAPREVRGHVARLLAAKLAIAARLDLYRGELVREFVDEANAKVDALLEVKK